MNLGNCVRFWASWNPDGESIVIDDHPVSWAALDERTNRVAAGLVAAGIAEGDRIGILANNCIEYIELAIAGYKVGSVLVPLNVRLTAPELAYIIGDAGCRAVVADPDLGAVAAEAIDRSTRTCSPSAWATTSALRSASSGSRPAPTLAPMWGPTTSPTSSTRRGRPDRRRGR